MPPPSAIAVQLLVEAKCTGFHAEPDIKPSKHRQRRGHVLGYPERLLRAHVAAHEATRALGHQVSVQVGLQKN